MCNREFLGSPSGNTGSITVNALHVTGPSIDIVVASAHSGITCSSGAVTQ
jgi:hypothetical protein